MSLCGRQRVGEGDHAVHAGEQAVCLPAREVLPGERAEGAPSTASSGVGRDREGGEEGLCGTRVYGPGCDEVRGARRVRELLREGEGDEERRRCCRVESRRLSNDVRPLVKHLHDGEPAAKRLGASGSRLHGSERVCAQQQARGARHSCVCLRRTR